MGALAAVLLAVLVFVGPRGSCSPGGGLPWAELIESPLQFVKTILNSSLVFQKFERHFLASPGRQYSGLGEFPVPAEEGVSNGTADAAPQVLSAGDGVIPSCKQQCLLHPPLW